MNHHRIEYQEGSNQPRVTTERGTERWKVNLTDHLVFFFTNDPMIAGTPMTVVVIEKQLSELKFVFSIPCRPSGIVVSNADYGALGAAFESWVRHGCLCRNPSLIWDVCFTLTSTHNLYLYLTTFVIVVKAPKSEGVVDPKSGERRLVSLLFEWQQGEERRSERGFL
ncbi:hypothetical protein TNCV_2449031 [Trichonephila clavipes]|uniref:Uncharacterized protein n=1 Tax=Trichonephila clavipes TaxID=2585209 RepID=A0A8X6VBZ5_TRICX|nr:hypothetical protein TNCV_2449031 [Trichonephila clavipes]